MTQKIFILTLVLTFLIQLAFSFYYSVYILQANLNFQNQNQQYKQLLKQNQQLLLTLSQLEKTDRIYQQIQSLPLIPIQNQINLHD